jgi:hypothetical protein
MPKKQVARVGWAAQLSFGVCAKKLSGRNPSKPRHWNHCSAGFGAGGFGQKGVGEMGSDQISGHSHSDDSHANTKICSEPFSRLPGDYKTEPVAATTPQQQGLRNLGCKKSPKTRDCECRAPKLSQRLLPIFHPKHAQTPLYWPQRQSKRDNLHQVAEDNHFSAFSKVYIGRQPNRISREQLLIT